MSGISVPKDRTNDAPAEGYCRNPACRNEDDTEFHFEVVDDKFKCPKCGGYKKPMVGLLVLVHLLIPDDAGPIVGKNGRYRLGCNEKRDHLATPSNLEAATGDPEVANCPICLEAAKQLGLIKPAWSYKKR